ncbi:MAG: methionine--tRNA ligase [Candidatus Binatus sp.]|uniref:methionine--tRNA ligase n=1 Tax=Candidatus Binatus sp. TaxID=2811406 RepID=UPI0027244F9A|nr:methionine--tRNA ligase [Candidatus Binatus sp.]MDO8433987.1 methionine--tRNA ligase [Candidatus Binatus sp.]
MADRIHITTAIFYSNGPPHIGHAWEFLATDTFARYQKRKLGRANVTFVTGTDEHGQKNRDAAAAQNLSPKAFADKISSLFRDADAKLSIEYDYFVRTTDPAHETFVQEMLRRTYERGDIYFKDYEGLYCVGCERFYTEKELIDGKICPAHNRPVELVKEGNYFLKLEKYREAIRAHIEQNADFIRPDRYRNEALRMLDEPLSDLSISRPKARLDWGIDLPFDANFVTYVWYDAFWAYLSPLSPTGDEALLKQILPATEHFIGKDILKTHAVYWPAMLLALGLPLFRHLNVHGFLNYGGERFSKSSGNIIDPVELAEKYGADVLRYFVLREFVYGLDGDFSEDRLIDRFNADLANDLGNLTSRVLSMAARYFNGDITATPGAGGDAQDAALAGTFASLGARVAPQVEELAFNRALETIWQALDVANKYIVATSPFTLAKESSSLPRVAQILANLVEGLRVIADTLEPFMPATSKKILELLNVDEQMARAPYGKGIPRGHRVKATTPLFPRIDKKARA